MILSVALCAALPASAQDSTDDFREGARKFGEALELFMEGFSKEMEPLAEAWRDLLEDLPKYEPPEELPNGDIILRRKDGAPGTDV